MTINPIVRPAVQGNAAKHERYRYAHERLKLAMQHGFFIEAAMLCESILADRMHSHLHWRVHEARLHAASFYGKASVAVAQPPDQVSAGKVAFVPFGVLARMLEQSILDDHRPDHPEPPRWVHLRRTVVPGALITWAKERNAVAHGAVKTHPTRKSYEQNYLEFHAGAEHCAEGGRVLVRVLTDWDRAVRRTHQRPESRL